MNQCKCALLGIAALFIAGILPAAEGDAERSETVNAFLNNQYLVENNRLLGLAEKSLADGQFEDSVKYAEEAIRYAKLSDDWVKQQMKIKEANDTIAAAQARLDWAKKIGAPKNFTAVYNEADTLFTGALDARSREDWDTSLDSARKVISVLSVLPEIPPLPAQYLVKSWKTVKDCLWNIAAKPEIYGDPYQWRVIYNANKSKLPKPDNPNLIDPGIILDIPSIKGETRTGILE